MTQQRDIERVLDHWFADGPDMAPDRVIDAVSDRIERQSQQPGWRLRLKETPMNGYLKPLLAIAAVLVIAIVGYNLLPGSQSGVGAPPATSAPTLTPSPSPSQVPSAAAFECGYGDIGPTGCLGPLPAGQHDSTSFLPAFSVVTPKGWENNLDAPSWYELRDDNQTIVVWSEVVAADQNDACDIGQKPGFGGTAQAWIDYVVAHPGLVATDPVPVTLGAFSGQSIDISVAPGWTKGCGGNDVWLFVQAPGAAQDVGYGLSAPQMMRVTFVDVGDRTVVIAAYGGPSADTFTADMADAQPVIDSLRFTP